VLFRKLTQTRNTQTTSGKEAPRRFVKCLWNIFSNVLGTSVTPISQKDYRGKLPDDPVADVLLTSTKIGGVVLGCSIKQIGPANID
jgi:hypothetical protein